MTRLSNWKACLDYKIAGDAEPQFRMASGQAQMSFRIRNLAKLAERIVTINTTHPDHNIVDAATDSIRALGGNVRNVPIKTNEDALYATMMALAELARKVDISLQDQTIDQLAKNWSQEALNSKARAA